MRTNDIASKLAAYAAPRRALIDKALDAALPSPDLEPRAVHAAMRYAALAPGKRLRPLMTLAACEAAGAPCERVLDAACAVEYIHAASLILDDLPCMDNADERRGLPCTHIEFGEATALLATVGLLTLAFRQVTVNAERLGANPGPPVRALADAVGTTGLIRGQHHDLVQTGASPSRDTVLAIQRDKAGALFVAAVRIPAGLTGMRERDAEALAEYADQLGLAFQSTDDIEDASGVEDAGKATLIAHEGTARTHERVTACIDAALAAIEPFGADAAPLRWLAEYVRTRSH